MLNCVLYLDSRWFHSWLKDHRSVSPQIHSLYSCQLIFSLPVGLLLATEPGSSIMAHSSIPDEISAQESIYFTFTHQSNHIFPANLKSRNWWKRTGPVLWPPACASILWKVRCSDAAVVPAPTAENALLHFYPWGQQATKLRAPGQNPSPLWQTIPYLTRNFSLACVKSMFLHQRLCLPWGNHL